MEGLAKTRRIGEFIISKLSQLNQTASTPLVIGINGAQGSGKTTLVNDLVGLLQTRGIRSIGFSLDDLYLPYQEQRQLAEQHRDNPLLKYRGQPGTQDLELGRQTLLSLLSTKEYSIRIPQYDKSLRGGYGDRMAQSEWLTVSRPPAIDVVLFEGWCLGFRSLNESELSKYLDQVFKGHSLLFKHSRNYSSENLRQINSNLKLFETALYPLIDAWIYMRVSDVDVVYRWRKEQEDYMAATGRASLSDQQLEDFVSRFLPTYELALDKLDKQGFMTSDRTPAPHTLRLHLNLDRRAVAWDHKL